MEKSRRDFLKTAGTIGTGLGISIPFHKTNALWEDKGERNEDDSVFNMCGYRAPALETVRIGFVGLGNRGAGAVERIKYIGGISVNGLCDIRPERVQMALNTLQHSGYSPAEFSGKADSWKSLCERNDIDVVYIATPWNLHMPIAIYAMSQGKHVALEVGNAESLEECWQLVNASETHKRHCIFLENCCYDFFELLTLNMARQGFFGEIVHCEGAYIHQLVASLFNKNARYDLWRLKENIKLPGNLYPTHGLGPICNILNINRGDKMDFLVSVSGADFTMKALEEEAYRNDPQTFAPFRNSHFNGNMNTSIIRTAKGKTILLQHDVSSTRVYSRIHLVSGTRGSALKYPLPGRISTNHEEWLSDEEMKKLEEQYTLPIVKKFGNLAKEVGGHGGMDFLMDWRWIDCLRHGLSIDNDVYDAALWSAVGPLTQLSVSKRSMPVTVPDFTRGAWKKNLPKNIDIDHADLTPVKTVLSNS